MFPFASPLLRALSSKSIVPVYRIPGLLFVAATTCASLPLSIVAPASLVPRRNYEQLLIKPKTPAEQRIEHKLIHYYDVNRYRENFFAYGGHQAITVGDVVHVIARRSAVRESRSLAFAGVVTRVRTRGVSTNIELFGMDAGIKIRRRFYAFSPLTYRITVISRYSPPRNMDFIERIAHNVWDGVNLRRLALDSSVRDGNGDPVPDILPPFVPDESTPDPLGAIKPREIPVFAQPFDVLGKRMRKNIKRRVRYNRNMDELVDAPIEGVPLSENEILATSHIPKDQPRHPRRRNTKNC